KGWNTDHCWAWQTSVCSHCRGRTGGPAATVIVYKPVSANQLRDDDEVVVGRLAALDVAVGQDQSSRYRFAKVVVRQQRSLRERAYRFDGVLHSAGGRS